MGNSISAGKAFLQLLVDNKEFAKGLDDGLKKLESFGTSAIRVGAGIAAAGAAITAPFVGALKMFADTGDQLGDMAVKTGLSAESLSILKFAAETTGTSLEQIGNAARKMQKEGLDPNRIFEFAEKIRSIEDPTKRAQEAFAIFGDRAGAAILPLLNDLPALSDKARELGIVWSSDMVANAQKFSQAMKGLQAQLLSVAAVIADSVAPAITDLIENVQAILSGTIDWAKHNQSLARIALTMGAALGALGTAITGVGVAAHAASIAVRRLGQALLFVARNPWVLLLTFAVAALLALVGPLLDSWLGLTDSMDEAAKSGDDLTGSQDKLNKKLAEGTKEISERDRALQDLTQTERIWNQLATEREKQEKHAKNVSNERVKALEEEIKAIDRGIAVHQGGLEDDIAIRNRALKERETASPKIQARIDTNLQENERRRQEAAARILALEERKAAAVAKRDELNGTAEKRREEQAKALAEEKKKAAEELARQQKEAAEAAADAREKQKQLVERGAESIQTQFSAFGRETRGGFGGRLAEQIGGFSASDSREERMLKIEEKMEKHLALILAELQKGKGIIFGNS